MRDVAERGIGGGRVSDALLLACARKSQAKTIFTWNLKHFRQLAPDLSERIRTP
jgi:predicted nucleic acid-binding protein